MCMGEKLSHSIKIKTRIGEFFLLRKNDFLKLSVNFHEIIQKFLTTSLLKYLKFNDEKKKAILKYEKEHEFDKKCISANSNVNADQLQDNNLWQINENPDEVSSNSSSASSSENSRSIASKPNSCSREMIEQKSNSWKDSKRTPCNFNKSLSLFRKDNNDNHLRKGFSQDRGSELNNSLYLNEMRDKVNNCKKNMNKTMGENIDKMIQILNDNKRKIAISNTPNNGNAIVDKSNINPIKLFNKMKNSINPEQRDDILNQLEELIKND